jgi:hypothetical protein
MRKVSKYAAQVSCLLLAMAFTTVSPAVAANVAPSEELLMSDASVSTETAPMFIAGYNEEVANANGFEIVIDEDGNTHSIPVTDEAKKLAAEFEQVPDPGFSTFGTVLGDCGTSSLFVSKSGSTKVYVTTSYSVYAPTWEHHWYVDGAAASGGFTINFSGGNYASSNKWNAWRDVSVNNNVSAFAQVRAGSFAQLITGAICYSGAPSDRY